MVSWRLLSVVDVVAMIISFYRTSMAPGNHNRGDLFGAIPPGNQPNPDIFRSKNHSRKNSTDIRAQRDDSHPGLAGNLRMRYMTVTKKTALQ